MAADFTYSVASGSAKATKTAVRITAVDIPSNDVSGDEIRYVIRASKSGIDSLQSVVFSPSYDDGNDFDGQWTWDNVIFPDDGTWTMAIIDVTDPDNPSSVHSESYVVAA